MHFANIIMKVYDIEAVIVQCGSQTNRVQNIRQLNELPRLLDRYGNTSPAKSRSSSSISQKDADQYLKNCQESILISLKAYDETASIRVLLYSNYFVDLPSEILESINFGKNASNGKNSESQIVKLVNKLVSDIKVGSVLSLENSSCILVNNCVNNGQNINYSQSLTVVCNLDNKYSKLQVYNLPENNNNGGETEDECDLANFLSDLPKERIRELTGVDENLSTLSTESGSSQVKSSAAFMSNYELILK